MSSKLLDTTLASLATTNLVIAVGSVDGVLTTAALLRVVGKDEIRVEWTQAFQVDKIDLSKWAANRQVAFVDLAVNKDNPAMTVEFVQKVRAAGHNIVAIIDEHGRAKWLEALGTFDGLAVEPRDSSSAGAVLLAALGNQADERTIELLDQANAGDKMDFTGRFASMANNATKSALMDNNRRDHVARHLAAGNIEPDEKIAGWVAEYEEMEHNHARLLENPADLGDGLLRVDPENMRVDITTLMGLLYKRGAAVAIVAGRHFVPGKGMIPAVAFGAGKKGLDLRAALAAMEVPVLSGFAAKVTVAPEAEAAAIVAIRKALLG